MAEKNIRKLTPFEKEQEEIKKKISGYKLSCEANIVAIIYKQPSELYNLKLALTDFSHNCWKVYFQIAYDIIITESKNTLDDITVGIYLEKHPKLKAKYDEYGGYDMIQSAKEYVQVENLNGYIKELKKWSVVINLCENGYPVKERLSDFADMSAEQIYQEFETYLNHVFINIDSEVKAYNIFDNMNNFIDELNQENKKGLPFYNAPLLTNEIDGFNYHGNIYGLGSNSGCGKSTMAFNYLVPSALENNKKIVFIINEEDENKFRKELIIWVANNVFKEELHKYSLRNGKFSTEMLSNLKKYAEWIEDRKDERTFTVIPLQQYSVNIVTKIINKYSALGIDIFVLDTLKESYDAKTDEIYKSMMRDMVTLYDVIKPSSKNVGLFVTYQLGKASLKMRHLTNNEIGQAKSILDVMSVNLMMRRPFEDEYDGGTKELKCWKLDGKNNATKIMFKLKKEDKPMITFITKNRFGITDAYQIVSKCDLSRNICKDIGYCAVPQDW